MLVEDIRRDTEDGLLYKFGYVKNADGSFLQLGILAEHIHEVLADFEITNLVHNISDRSDVKDVFILMNPTKLLPAVSRATSAGR